MTSPDFPDAVVAVSDDVVAVGLAQTTTQSYSAASTTTTWHTTEYDLLKEALQQRAIADQKDLTRALGANTRAREDVIKALTAYYTAQAELSSEVKAVRDSFERLAAGVNSREDHMAETMGQSFDAIVQQVLYMKSMVDSQEGTLLALTSVA